MELRSGAVVGSGVLPSEARPAFEEATTLLFRRWTALNLAVENEWGGRDSAEKAQWLWRETVNWFYGKKEHYVDELEDELEDALLNDFNVQVEDGSPLELAKHLVQVYHQLVRGDLSGLEHLRATMPAAVGAAARSRQQVVDRDGTVVGDGGDDSSSSSGSGTDDDTMQEDQPVACGAQEAAGASRARPPPVVDEDGFTVVPTRRRGR